MVTLSFILLALLPQIVPALLALVMLAALCAAPSVTFEAEETELYVAEQTSLWTAVRDAYNAAALELGLAMVESQATPLLPAEPCPDTLRSPTMADAVFAGLAITRRDYNVAAILELAG